MKKTPQELRAMAYALADEIETRARVLIAAGVPRVRAINAVLSEMAR